MILLLVAQLLLKQSYAFPARQQWLTEKQEIDYPDDNDELISDVVLFGFIIVWVPLSYLILSLWRCLLRNISRRFSRNGIHLMDSEVSTGVHESNDIWGGVLDNEEEVRDKVARLSPEEQFYYKQGEEFIKQNPPLILPYEPIGSSSNGGDTRDGIDPIINDQTLQYIEEEGARAWEFQPSSNLPNDFVTVEDKTELIFSNYNSDASVMTNLPIPLINRVYYFECKIFELNHVGNRICNDQPTGMELLSFGLATSPYPYFRLPGRHHHSIAYDSNGARRLNNSFNLSPELATIFPKCEKGDVVGVGYRTRSGTVFFTRNGTKLKEKAVGGHIRGWKFKYLYPIVGANIPCRIHVNFGTYGFVYIEANVKKWGYAKSTGMKLPPPTYEDYDQGMLLESAHEDEISDTESSVSFSDILYHDGYLLPPPPGFEFSTTPNSIRDQFTMDSLPVEPPGYSSDGVDNEIDVERRGSDVEASEEHDSAGRAKLLSGNTHANTFANQFIEPNDAGSAG